MKPAVLYISYDGMLEPLGQSQVISYLENLSKDYNIFLLSFEKQNDLNELESFKNLSKRVQFANINWIFLKYHKHPSVIATLFDVVHGLYAALNLCYKNDIKIVHSRSYVASLIALQLKIFYKVKFVFDMRGLWADERVDGGLWRSNSSIYKFTKWMEGKYLLNADTVVSLTNSSVEYMQNFKYLRQKNVDFRTIPTCVNLEKFKLSKSAKNKDEYVVGYVGSVGVWYLFDEVLRAFKIVKSKLKNAKLLIINRGGHSEIIESIEKSNLDLSDFKLIESDHEKIVEFIQTMDLAIYFYKPSISRIACSPTKLGEFLACGIPVITNTGVGDQDKIITNNNNPVGAIVKNFDNNNLISTVNNAIKLSQDDKIHKRCRDVARRHFSLTNGSLLYRKIYADLLSKG